MCQTRMGWFRFRGAISVKRCETELRSQLITNGNSYNYELSVGTEVHDLDWRSATKARMRLNDRLISVVLTYFFRFTVYVQFGWFRCWWLQASSRLGSVGWRRIANSLWQSVKASSAPPQSWVGLLCGLHIMMLPVFISHPVSIGSSGSLSDIQGSFHSHMICYGF